MRTRAVGLASAAGVVLLVGSCGPSPAAPTDCSLIAVAPNPVMVPASSGTTTLSVSAPTGCGWQAATNSTTTWATISSGGSGTGPGNILLSVQQNLDGFGRSGTIAVGSHLVAIEQAGAVPGPQCTYELTPAAKAMPADGNWAPGTDTGFRIDIRTTCPWTFQSHDAWLDLHFHQPGTGTNGFGNGLVLGQVEANPSPSPRTATATVAGQLFTVVQDGTAAAACSYAIAPDIITVPAAASTGLVTVTTGPFCSWLAEASATGEDWMTQTIRGAGPDDVVYTIAPNRSLTSRVGEWQVFGESGAVTLRQRVEQSGAGCVYDVSPAHMHVPGVGEAAVDISVSTSDAGCSWTARSSVAWMAIVGSGSGVGSGTVRYRVGPNTGALRTGQVIIEGLSGLNPDARHDVTQDAGSWEPGRP